jgi:hypothetical protein
MPLQSVQLFLPVIIACLGYNTVKTNLYTVASNVSGAVMLLILAFESDLTHLRFPFIALGLLFTFIGFIIYASIDVQTQLHVAYYACFMMTWGTSAPNVILDVCYNNNIADENRRVMLTSVGVRDGQPRSGPDRDRPRPTDIGPSQAGPIRSVRFGP